LTHSYGQILKSSALIGSSSVLTIAIGIVRTKAMAVMLGPSGVGLIGLYSAVADLARSVAGLGINASGVRQIAEAAGSRDEERVARVAAVLNRTSIALGLVGVALLVAIAQPVSTLTFGTQLHAPAIAALALAVLFQLLADARGAALQGLRRIGGLAKAGVLSALLGTAASIPIVYVLREDGIVPSLVVAAFLTFVVFSWCARNVAGRAPSLGIADMLGEQKALLKLGLAFLASALLMQGTTYIVRVLVLKDGGTHAAGLYQCAWTLGGLYAGLILQAMGTDFYPRLTAAARDHAECNRLVNEQAFVSILLAGPGILATLALAPVIISLFYAATFEGATSILRWICLGIMLRVISWPMGYIILAKGRQSAFFWSELAWTCVYLGLAWMCIEAYGAEGAGIAFFGSYLFHCVLIYTLVTRMTGFTWSRWNRRAGLLTITLVGAVFGGFYVLPTWVATALGLGASALSGAYALRTLLKLVSAARIPAPLLGMLTRVGLVSQSSGVGLASESKGR
jgi:PST family polysaccharide transporter